MIGNVKKAAAMESAKHTTDSVKLMEEIATLKDSRNLLEKKLRNCTCTSGAVKATKNFTNDTKIDQITTSAKAEIQRLVSHDAQAWFSDFKLELYGINKIFIEWEKIICSTAQALRLSRFSFSMSHSSLECNSFL